MLKIITIVIIAFTCIPLQAIDEGGVRDWIEKLRGQGVSDLFIVYDWGDGTVEKFPVDRFTDSPVHYYEKEGTYAIITKVTFAYKGRTGEQIVERRQFDFRREEIDCTLVAHVPGEAQENEPVLMKAHLRINEKGLQTKNLAYQWIIDDDLNPFEQGPEIRHTFLLPNGDLKPHYTVKLRVIFKYQRGPSNVWLPFEIKREFRISIVQTSRLRIIDWSKKIAVRGESFLEPFFLTLRDGNVFQSREHYTGSKLLYRPIVFINDRHFYPELVDMKTVAGAEAPWNEEDFYSDIVYLLELDQTGCTIASDESGRFVLLTVKLNDPQGLVQENVKIRLEEGDL
ncbi:MAG: hypothetical protein PHQ23_12275 [Candidatus Wallbacteria bacterium]|nr:hypothetical protein [Candidatus Wallbacteria bacterium]